MDLLVDDAPDLLDPRPVGDVVQVGLDDRPADDESLQLLVAEDGSDAAAPRLLQARGLPAEVPEGEVEAADVRVVRALPRRDDGHVLVVLGARRVHVREDLGQDVAVGRLEGALLDPDDAARTVDDDDDLGGRLPLDLDRVEAAELQERPVVAADVAVDRDVRQGRDRDDERLAGPRVLRDAGDRPGGDDDLVLRVVPARRRRRRVPEVPEAEAAPADEEVLHLLRDLLLGHLHGRQVDVERPHVVAALRLARRERHLEEDLVGRPHLLEALRVARADGVVARGRGRRGIGRRARRHARLVAAGRRAPKGASGRADRFGTVASGIEAGQGKAGLHRTFSRENPSR